MPLKYLNRNNRGQANPVGPGSWTTGFNAALSNYCISYGSGSFVAAGDSFLANSTNANSWNRTNISPGIRNVAYGNGLWVAVSPGTQTNNVIFTSSDGGASWTNLSGQVADGYRWGVAYGNNVWVIMCESNTATYRIYTSTNGSTWTAYSSTTINNAFCTTRTISFGGGTFVVVCQSGPSGANTICFTSTDGTNWTQRTLPTSTNWNSAAYGNGVWVSVGNGAAARSTNNGATWSDISGRSGTGVTYGDGYFVIAGNSPAYSTDGINWTTISSGPPANSSTGGGHIAYGNGIFASVRDATSSNVSTSPMSYIYSQVSSTKFLNRSNVPTVSGTQNAIFGYGNGGHVTNIVSNTGVVSNNTTGVGTGRYNLAAAGYGTDKAIFGYGDNSGNNVSMTNLVSNTGVVSTDTTGVGTARYQLAAAGYGSDKAIFGYGAGPGGTGLRSMTNKVSNTGVVSTDTDGVGTARYGLAAAGYGTDKAIFGYGYASPSYLSITNKVSNTGVVIDEVGGVGTARRELAAASYGADKAIFGYGGSAGGLTAITNLVSNTGVVANDTTGVGTARIALAAAGYGTDKAIFGYGNVGFNVSMTNKVSNTGVVATDTSGVGSARQGLAAAGYSVIITPAGSNFKVKKVFADPTIVTSGLVLNLDASNASSYPGNGTSWFDLSGNSNTGTLTNGPTFNSANGGSIVFDGSDDYVNLGNAPSIKMGTGDFTISTWVKILTQTGTATFKGIISSKQAGAASAGYGFYWNNSVNKFLWSTGNGSSSSEIFTTNAWSSLVNVWANIVMIRQNGATNNGHFYINGVYEPLVSAATVLNVDTTTNMTLGNVADFYSPYWFTGTYGATQIYNRALTASEILQNYNVTKTRFGL